MEPTERRRVAVREPEEDAKAKRGCITLGAVLGVVVGAVAAFFLIPPLMGHYFGEASVATGKTYDGDAKLIRVEGIERVAAGGQPFPGVFEVRLAVTTNKTWTPSHEDFELDRGTGEQRVKALEPAADRVETQLVFPLGQERVLTLRFPGSQRADAEPKTLFVKDPRVRFELEGQK